jgi:Ca2+/H+ antiporter, TMEM165/GDT1 family
MAQAADRKVRTGQTDDMGSPARVEGVSCRRASSAPRIHFMEAILTSTAVVAIAEMGDKTQLLAIVLAARFRKPIPIVLGILVATLLNHAVAAGIGYLVAELVTGRIFQVGLGLAFIVMAAWALVPDEQEATSARSPRGIFLTTLIAFFLVEIGDKTQIATSLLAAQFREITLVTIGTTAGMMLANVPAVFLGEAVTKVVPLKYVRIIAAVIFAAIGLWIVLATLNMTPGLVIGWPTPAR